MYHLITSALVIANKQNLKEVHLCRVGGGRLRYKYQVKKSCKKAVIQTKAIAKCFSWAIRAWCFLCKGQTMKICFGLDFGWLKWNEKDHFIHNPSLSFRLIIALPCWLSVESISFFFLRCFHFASLCYVVGWQKFVALLSQLNKKQSQNQSWLARTHFSALGAVCSYTFLLRVLIVSLRCFRMLWLARVITMKLIAVVL